VTFNATPDDRELALAPLDEKVDHVRGPAARHLIIEYGDYECPYSRQAIHAIEQVERQLGGKLRFAFRHLRSPMTTHAARSLNATACSRVRAWRTTSWPSLIRTPAAAWPSPSVEPVMKIRDTG
jgi:hypothetical protein